MSYGQAVKHVTSSQASSGADKAAAILNNVNAKSQYTNFGRKPISAPKPRAGTSLAHGATELAKLQGEWNTICNLFGWKGAGGRRRRPARTRRLRPRRATRRPAKKSRSSRSKRKATRRRRARR